MFASNDSKAARSYTHIIRYQSLPVETFWATQCIRQKMVACVHQVLWICKQESFSLKKNLHQSVMQYSYIRISSAVKQSGEGPGNQTQTQRLFLPSSKINTFLSSRVNKNLPLPGPPRSFVRLLNWMVGLDQCGMINIHHTVDRSEIQRGPARADRCW